MSQAHHGKPPVVVFDLDGTLVDTAPDLTAATNHILTAHGRRPVSLNEVRDMVGFGARMLILRGFERTGDPLNEAEIAPLYQMFLDYYQQHIADNSVIFEGMPALIENCRSAGCALAVCTNKLEHLSLAVLKALDLEKHFDAIIGPDTIGVAKPDPAPLLEAIARSGGEPRRSFMIGDSETDIKTAKAAGVSSIAVTFGYSQQPVSSFDPDYCVDHINEIWPIIKPVTA